MSIFQYLTTYAIMFHPTAYIYSNIWGLTLPIAGLLADVSLRNTMAHLQHISFAGINVIPQYIHTTTTTHRPPPPKDVLVLN